MAFFFWLKRKSQHVYLESIYKKCHHMSVLITPHGEEKGK